MSVAVVQEAATDRLLQLDADRRPVITPGRTGRITATIRPACLRLLTGTVQQPNRTGTRFDFLLDEASTERLRLDPNNGTRFRIAKDEKRYRLARPRRQGPSPLPRTRTEGSTGRARPRHHPRRRRGGGRPRGERHAGPGARA
ncbi:hypothetical protein, partial [Streptomyces mirabilis]|uniref:hypothetical protein n=1 Tax=Streptomyces mirabilis TaxID=68239 RepID=UPI0033AF47AA